MVQELLMVSVHCYLVDCGAPPSRSIRGLVIWDHNSLKECFFTYGFSLGLKVI